MSRLIALCLLPSLLFARDASAVQVADTVIEQMRADYAIPDAPALTLLGLDESDLLRPTSVRDLSVALGEFTGEDGGFRLPRAFAVEFSPGLLFFGKKLTIQQYRPRAKLYRLRISAAVQRDDAGSAATHLALGLRTSLSDKSDLRLNKAFLNRAGEIITRAAVIDSIAEERAEEIGLDAPVEYTADELNRLQAIEQDYKTLISDAAETTWNAEILDAGAGLRLDAADSLGNGLATQQVAGWFTYAGGVGAWGQFVLGLKVSSERDSVTRDFEVAASGAGRFYAGSNRYKVYGDFQGSKQGDTETTWLVSGGLELNVIRGIWAVVSAGDEWGGGIKDNRLRAHFGLKGGFPH